MKSNSNHIEIIYLHFLERQKILTTSNNLKTKKSLRLVWQTIKGTIKVKKESGESVSSLLIDGEIITSAKEISNYSNKLFTSVTKKINKNIVKSKKTKKNTYPTLAMKTITQFSFLQLYQRTLKT